MAFDFPSSPTTDQIYTSGSSTFKWNGYAWIPQGSGYVAKAGDTMSGDLKIDKNDARLSLNQAATSTTIYPRVEFKINNLMRWSLSGAWDTNPSDAHFSIDRYNNAGTLVESALVIDRSTGIVSVSTDASQTAKDFRVATTNFVKVWAAPFDALGSQGIQVNGDMSCWSEYGGVLTAVPNTVVKMIADTWYVYSDGTVRVSAQPVVDGPSGLRYSIKINVTTASGALTGGNCVTVLSPIEGYRCSKLGWGTAQAQPITLCFWTKIHRPGTYTICIQNNNSTRYYTSSYNHAVADVWQYNTVTIPGDTTGVWEKESLVGMWVTICMATSSSITSPANNVWGGGSYTGGAGQINGAAATSDVFQITGILILPGTEAPTSAKSPLLFREVYDELFICNRYYCKIHGSNRFYSYEAGLLQSVPIEYPAQMLRTPTISIQAGARANISTVAVSAITPMSCVFDIASAGVGTCYALNDILTIDGRLA